MDVDFDGLLSDLSAEYPSGENLEYDPDFGELERLSQGKEEVQYGDTVVEAEEPDWRAVASLAVKLLERTRDLRVATKLAPAILNINGFAGFADCLGYIGDLLEQRWDSVHPELDPDDNNDPTLRVNTLAALRANTPFLRAVRITPLISSRALGRFSLRDLEIANGEATPPPDTEAVTKSTIEGALADIGPEEATGITATLSRAITQTERIESVLTDKVGSSESIDLGLLRTMLKKALNQLSGYIGSEPESATATAADEPVNGGIAQAGQAGAAPASTSGTIQNTDDVKKMLDKICDFYRTHEPSSPVPLLLLRAKNLVSKDFFQIIEDLAPDAMDQVQRVSGPRESE